MELVGVINIIKGAALHLAVLISGPCSVAGFTDALQCNTAIIKELIAHVLFLPSQDKMSAHYESLFVDPFLKMHTAYL